ncbi:MAG: hypothetical protein EHM28_09070 [Spirochaetaceae bacterium]|nr:MAG: hypothetical protein EHM28_09070 [Spirochaetaceae bacterium]
MDIVIFTNSEPFRKKLRAKGLFSLPTSELRKGLSQYSGPVLVYIDLSGFSASWEKTLAMLSKRQHIYYGVLDPKKQVKNVMELVFGGAVDYLCGTQIAHELGIKRIKKITAYLKKYRIDYSQTADHEKKIAAKSIEYIPVAGGWQDIVPGTEYTFSIMFVELDDQQEMEKKYGKKNLESALEVFRRYIERNSTAFGGRLWMWSRFGGIVLFPFNAEDSTAVLCGFRLMLYKFMHDVEESFFPHFISFRIALHLGNMKYQENNTGEVISDSINSIFHIGKKFAEPGNLYVTQEIFNYAPAPIKSYFKSAGTFESRPILKMRRPIIET